MSILDSRVILSLALAEYCGGEYHYYFHISISEISIYIASAKSKLLSFYNSRQMPSPILCYVIIYSDIHYVTVSNSVLRCFNKDVILFFVCVCGAHEGFVT